jgi:CheY-like chemotaxis protein
MLSLLRTLLEFEGFKASPIDHARSVPQIMEALLTEMPDLLMLDLHLDQVNGIELLRNLRRDEKFKPMRILVASGRAMSQECFQAGADGFIMKPFMPDDLIRQIHDILRN